MIEFSALQVLNVVSFTVFVAANYLAQSLTFGAGTNAHSDISGFYPNIFTPAPWTFSIWGLIFIALGLFTAYQAMPMNKYHELFSKSVGLKFAAFNGLACCWLVAFQNHWITSAFLVMTSMLFTAVYIYSSVIGDFSRRQASLTRLDWWLVQVPFSATTSWVGIAWTANLFVWLQYLHFENASWSNSWANAAIVSNAMVGLVALLVPDPTWPLVTIWGLAGVSWKNSGVNYQVSSVAMTAAIALGVANLIISTSIWSAGATFLKRMPDFPHSAATEPRPTEKSMHHNAPMRDRHHVAAVNEEKFVEPIEQPPRRKASFSQRVEELVESAGGEMEPRSQFESEYPAKSERAPIIQDVGDVATSMQA